MIKHRLWKKEREFILPKSRLKRIVQKMDFSKDKNIRM
ncbi:hypothetical protein MTTB_p330 (plasmid) [Methanothermobacter tenebrarum]|uniref:Uncharacterized protein n=1 Tax=Methanothermobacter tenebrarum TaxID=680118 RepID=A0ABM7YFD9_9EURY|nr:hypothetical protein MTTB_p330 [Methanothermobacter tenebrarum]